ncbi:MAG: phage holin family protein [Verrucomicrobiae bacterium]|nr:phage holin family protein [Verrucomicrobiae bacterium]
MNSETAPPTSSATSAGPPEREPSSSGPTSWAEALGGLVQSRIGIIRIEAGEAARTTVRRAVFAAVAALAALFAWALLIAGLVGLVVLLAGWPWPYVMLGAAGIHLVAAIIAIIAMRRPASPAFPLTLEEFKKDRAWLETLQKNKKSSD